MTNFTDPKFYGKFPIRTEIEVLGPDKPMIIGMRNALIINCRGRMSKRSRFLGWTVSEKIGIGIINPRGIKAGSKSTIVGK